MRIPSGVTDQYIYFVAVDATDLATRETGLTGFTVYRSRNGGTAAAYTTPTINETDATNMPGVYELLLDEDMSLDAGDQSQEVALHITHASMAPVTRTFELYRPSVTAGETLTVGSGIASADVVEWLGTAPATPTVAGVPEVDVTHVLGGGTYGSSGQLSVNVRAVGTSTTAVTNMTAAYDGTGYAGGTTKQEVVLSTAGNAAVADAVWDEDITGHRAANSAGAMQQPIRSAACRAGGNTTTVVLDAGASSTTDAYKYQIIEGWVTADGTNKFSDIISAYDGTTKAATVTGIPYSTDTTYTYVIRPFGAVPGATAPTAGEVADAVLDEALSGHTTEGTVGALFGAQHLHAGTAQAGGAASITLDATGSSTTVDFYKYNIVVIRGGTGAGQARQISAYSAARVATVSPAWTTQPSTDSEYVIIPLGIDASTPSAVATAVWAATRAANATAGSFGEYVNADTVRISNNATAADNAQAAFDGTGFGFTGCTIPTVTTVTTLTGHTPQTGDSYALLGSPAGASVSADIAAIKAETASILTDTGTTLDTAIGTLTTNVATVDTVVDAIKVKTDSLTFTVAGQVDANVQSINDVTVAGDGGTTTPWGV